MPVEKISHEESLFEGTEKLNASIEQSNDAIKEATTAKSTANQAVSTSQEAVTKAESVQAQFNQVVIEGDSSVEAAQARVGVDNKSFPTLKSRLDSEISTLQTTTTDFVFYTFFRNNTDISNDMFVSSDGVELTRINTSGLSIGRDTSILYRDGFFYMAYTSYNPHDFSIAKSKDLKTWQRYNIDLDLYNGINKVWAPEWFEDANGDIYIIISVSNGTSLDANNQVVSDFRQYITKVTNLSSLSFSQARKLTLEETNKIDGCIARFNNLYYLIVKDEYDKKIEIWTSSDLYSWVKKTDYIESLGTNIEGPSVVFFKNQYYIYCDSYDEGQTYVVTTTDFETFTGRVPVKTKYEHRHGSGSVMSNFSAKKVIADYIASNPSIPKRNFKKQVNLSTLAVAGVITELIPINDVIYMVNNGESITIKKITNSLNVKEVSFLIRTNSTGKLVIESSGDVETPGTQITYDVATGDNDRLLKFKWIESISKFKSESVNFTQYQTKTYDKYTDGHTRINLNTIASSGGTISSLNAVNGAFYCCLDNETFTISGITSGSSFGSRIFLCFLGSTGGITLKSGNDLVVPGGTFIIDSTKKDMIYELVKMSGTSYRLKAN